MTNEENDIDLTTNVSSTRHDIYAASYRLGTRKRKAASNAFTSFVSFGNQSANQYFISRKLKQKKKIATETSIDSSLSSKKKKSRKGKDKNEEEEHDDNNQEEKEEEEEEEEEEDDDDEEEEEEEEEEKPQDTTTKKQGKKQRQQLNKKKKTILKRMGNTEYLELPSTKELMESIEMFDKRTTTSYDPITNRKKEILQRHTKRFLKWRSQMICGFNVLVSGLGSKISLLQEFGASILQDSFVIQLHGYLPNVSLRYLCTYLYEQVLEKKVPSGTNIVEHCQDIVRQDRFLYQEYIKKKKLFFDHAYNNNFHQKKKKKTSSLEGKCSATTDTFDPDVPECPYRVFLIVHSIDGKALRHPEIQKCLSILSTGSLIHVIASMDHINASCIWHEKDTIRFRWVYTTVNTFEPYQKEVALQLLPDQKEIIQSTSGIQYILESLTPTDVSLLKLIATLQLEKLASTSTSTSTSSIQQQTLGTHVLDYQRIYDLARKKLILTTALGMRNALKCLEEHFLIKKIRIKNEEKIFVPFPEHIIQTAILQQVN